VHRPLVFNAVGLPVNVEIDYSVSEEHGSQIYGYLRLLQQEDNGLTASDWVEICLASFDDTFHVKIDDWTGISVWPDVLQSQFPTLIHSVATGC
jgi:hypothetical protein